MKETLQSLVRLQKTDERLAVLARRLQSLPEELGQRESQQAALEAGSDALQAERKSALARMQELENDVRQHETRVAKLEDQIRNTRDPGSVKIAQRELDELRARISEDEDEALGLLDSAEALARKHAASLEKVAEGKAEFEGFEAIVKQDQAELQGEIQALEAERKAIADSVEPGPLESYERLAPSRKGRPMALLKGDSCGGCGIIVPPNDRVKVKAMRQLAFCKSCNRILVLAEIWSPETAETEATE